MRSDYANILSKTIINGLEKRQMKGYYCETSKEARKLALSLVNSGSTVAFGGSVTLEECGLLKELRTSKDINLIDRAVAKDAAETKEMYHKALCSDYYFMSTNAITKDGQLVNIDGNGNRVAALIYGPENVIIICGLNKVTSTVEEAVNRVHEMAAPPNCLRLNKKTPCAATGACGNCQSPDCICCQTVITRRSNTKDRIKVILVGENLGY